MKKFVFNITFLLLAMSTMGQSPLVPVMKITFTGQTGFTDPYVMTGQTGDFTSNWDAANMGIGDTVFQEDGPALMVFVIEALTPSGTNFTMTINDIYDTGNLPQLTEAAHYGNLQNRKYLPFVGGVSESLQTKIQNRFFQNIDIGRVDDFQILQDSIWVFYDKDGNELKRDTTHLSAPGGVADGNVRVATNDPPVLSGGVGDMAWHSSLGIFYIHNGTSWFNLNEPDGRFIPNPTVNVDENLTPAFGSTVHYAMGIDQNNANINNPSSKYGLGARYLIVVTASVNTTISLGTDYVYSDGTVIGTLAVNANNSRELYLVERVISGVNKLVWLDNDADAVSVVTGDTTQLNVIPSLGCVIGNSTIAEYLGQTAVADLLLTAKDSTRGDSVISIAVAGNTIVQQQTAFLGHSRNTDFDWVFLQIGLNDMNPATNTLSAVIDRYQTLVDTITFTNPTAIILAGTMVPAFTRWQNLYGADSLAAQAIWQGLNDSIIDGTISGIDYAVSTHTFLLGDPSDRRRLGPLYDTGDGIHENTAGRQIIADEWRRGLNEAGFLEVVSSITNTIEANRYKQVVSDPSTFDVGDGVVFKDSLILATPDSVQNFPEMYIIAKSNDTLTLAGAGLYKCSHNYLSGYVYFLNDLGQPHRMPGDSIKVPLFYVVNDSVLNFYPPRVYYDTIYNDFDLVDYAASEEFFTATGISDNSTKSAIYYLEKELRENFLWSKMRVLYPFAGTTAQQNQYNLLDTAQFKVTWNGTISHTAKGIKGVTNGYGQTGFVPTVNGQGAGLIGTIGAYLQTIGTGFKIIFGGANTAGFAGQTGITLNSTILRGSYRSAGSSYFAETTKAPGLFTGTRFRQTSIKCFLNGIEKSENTLATTAPGTSVELYLLANNLAGTPNYYYTDTVSFAFVADTLSVTQQATLTNIIENYQRRMARSSVGNTSMASTSFPEPFSRASAGILIRNTPDTHLFSADLTNSALRTHTDDFGFIMQGTGTKSLRRISGSVDNRVTAGSSNASLSGTDGTNSSSVFSDSDGGVRLVSSTGDIEAVVGATQRFAVSGTQVGVYGSGTAPLLISPTGGFHSNPTNRAPNAGGNAAWIFENSGDANQSWLVGRLADGTFEISNSTAQPYSGIDTRYLGIDPTTRTMTLGESTDTVAIVNEGIVVDKSVTITTTASTKPNKSVIFYDLTTSGTVTLDLSDFPDDGDILIINKDVVAAGVSVTVSVSGATWADSTNPVLAGLQPVKAHLLGGVLYKY